MSDSASNKGTVPEDGAGNMLYKKDFWDEENLKYSRPHLSHGKGGATYQ